MDNLADGQGGNGDHVESTHAPGSQNNEGGADGEKSDPVTQQGIDKMVSKLSAQLHQYSQVAKDIKTLAEAVQTMRKDIGQLKRKSQGENEDAPASKQPFSTTGLPTTRLFITTGHPITKQQRA